MSRVDALLREREGYVRRNLPDRVAQVDAQLALAGYKPEIEATVAAPVVETATVKRAPGRPRKAD